jgi:hypothetical protein
VKIYLFNPENGIYLGEDYADEEPMKHGKFQVPPDATTIAPPSVGHGEVPVLNFRDQRWEIRRIEDMQINLNYIINRKTPAGDTL